MFRSYKVILSTKLCLSLVFHLPLRAGFFFPSLGMAKAAMGPMQLGFVKVDLLHHVTRMCVSNFSQEFQHHLGFWCEETLIRASKDVLSTLLAPQLAVWMPTPCECHIMSSHLFLSKSSVDTVLMNGKVSRYNQSDIINLKHWCAPKANHRRGRNTQYCKKVRGKK